MSESDDRDRELAELRAQVERLSAAQAGKPPKVEVTGGPSSGGGFKGGFFGCFGVVAAIVALVVVLGVIGQCSKNVAQVSATPSATPSSPAASASGASTPSTAETDSNWTYVEKGDALHDAKTKLACTTSIDQVHLDFPYHDTDARLCLRKAPGSGVDAYVELNGDGQILCGIESCNLHVRFDKGAVQNYPAVGAADNSSNIIFLNRTLKLIAEVKKSSSTVVELNLYQAGMQTLTFNTAGLKWP
jgi:hypothetical protein